MKICDICVSKYPDDLPACPKCGPQDKVEIPASVPEPKESKKPKKK